VAASQLPQFSAASPHPAGDVPQTQPAGHDVFGTHTPQTFVVPPPPQVSPAAVSQPPQWSVVPHPSLTSPQVVPGTHTFGVQHFSA
jgi:hypothetical protein